ncbi:MAG: penicillin-binding protein 2 [Planctomycetes bacterium]|nr:penicillin-binding protein 2 [Planctomycetota bacterium]
MKNSRYISVPFYLLIAVFFLLITRCLYLQLIKHDKYTDISLKQHRSLAWQKPQRGVILDSQGRVLAASNKIQTIFAEPRIIKEPEKVAAKLAPILNTDSIQIYKLITESKNPGFVKLMENANQQQCEAARKIYGVGIQTTWRRYYPSQRLASHILGFTSKDNRGLDGIELMKDKELAGLGGHNVFLADSSRRPIRLKDRTLVKDGIGIILTIDSAVQQFAREELYKRYTEYQAESAIAIVADPKTGAILALVSLPDFDPENANTADPNSLRNRALTDQFEPGSLLKPLAAAIAIDANVVNLNEKIFCEYGNYRGKGFGRIGEYGDHQFGDLNVKEILVNSSNIGMAKIGQRLGKEKLYKGMKLFGFGQTTGIDLPGETSGRLWPVKKWTGYSVTRIPFGQEITVTAIQLVKAFCTLANGGKPITPYLIKGMVANDGTIVYTKRLRATAGFIVKPEVANWIVRQAMTDVVNRGTGKRAKLDKWQVFGKTGTANIAKADQRGYSERDYIASFIAGAPADDPQIIVLVSLRKPNIKLGKGYTGGVVASPVAAKIIEKTLTYLEKQR